MWQKLICCLWIVTFFTACSSTDKIAPKPPIPCGIITLESGAGMKAGEAESITEMLSAGLQNTGRFAIMERKLLNAVLQEQGLQSTQEGEGAAKAGKISGIRKMISGSIGMLGEKYIINVKVIDMESSQIEFARTWTYDDDLEDIDEEFLPQMVQDILLVVDGPQEEK